VKKEEESRGVAMGAWHWEAQAKCHLDGLTTSAHNGAHNADVCDKNISNNKK